MADGCMSLTDMLKVKWWPSWRGTAQLLPLLAARNDAQEAVAGIDQQQYFCRTLLQLVRHALPSLSAALCI